MGFLGLKRKPREEKIEEPVRSPVAPLPPVLNVLVPDIAGSTSFHLRQFYDIDEAREYIQALPSTSGLHAFWGLHSPPDGHVTGEGTGESMVLIRSAEDSNTVYVVSFVDLDSANAFARFEAKRGMSLGLLLIYWAEIVDIVVDDLSVSITPEVAPRAGRRTVPAAPEPQPLAASEPVQAPQPKPVAAAPVVEAPAPEPVAAEPAAEAPEPEPVAASEPAVQEPELEPAAAAPVVETPAPEPVATQPAVKPPEPQPVAAAEPVVLEPEPEPVAAEPVVENAGPEPVAAEPAIEAPQTEPIVETRPLFGTSAPKPVTQGEAGPVAATEPEPLSPEPSPNVHVEPEVPPSEPAPIAEAEDEGFSAHVEPEPVAETAPAAEEREALFNVEPDVTLPMPEPVAEVTPPPPAPEPELEVTADPVAEVTPQTVPDTPEIEPDLVEHEPEPVAEPAAELAESEPEPAVPEPEYAETPEPEPIVDELPAQPQPQADAPKHFEVRLKMPGSGPEPAFEEELTPEPEPVAFEEPEPLETPPPLFRASYAGGATKEEMDIEREAAAFLKASTNGQKSPLEDEPDEAASPDPSHMEPLEVVEEAASVNGAWTETAGAAAAADDTGRAPAEQEPPVDGQASEDRVQEVEKILKVKRWNKKDSPFRGFDSPPGRF